jgi:anti-sigma regulatory factor (Ser/Thr protein kinase)
VGALDAGVVHEARCSHPVVVEAADRRPSRHYRQAEQLVAPFSTPLARPATPTETLAFERDTLGEVRRVVARRASAAGLDSERASDVILAASEIATNSVIHGGGHGVLRVWDDDGALVCEVRDRGHIRDPLAGRRRPGPARSGGWGLWIAHRVCDLVQVRSKPGATVVRLFMHPA